MSKVLKKILYIRMITFIETNKLLNSKQLGFRKQRSCTHAVMVVTEFMRFKKARFLDLKDAFDSIDHNILLENLSIYRFRGVVHKILTSYLSGRSKYVEVNGARSRLLTLTCGVPQGSVLGPLLFLMYIDDLSDCFEDSQAVLFADDTTAFAKSNTPNCSMAKTVIR